MKHYYSLFWALVFTPTFLHATPYIPAQDNTIVERLPYRATDPSVRQSATLRAALKREPQNLNLALTLAKQNYDIGLRTGDPRFIAYAEAALQPWWHLPNPPHDVAVLRAAIRQYRHDFAGSLLDLGRVLDENPRHAPARAQRAAIYLVQARYADSRADCQQLRNGSSALISIACVATADALSGSLHKSYQVLRAAYEEARSASAEEKLWVLNRLAEMQQRAGNARTAETHYLAALSLGIQDVFLLASYADFLLDNERPQAVLKLLKGAPPTDGLLLRQVLAAQRLQLPDASRLADDLRARFAAANLRGDKTHQQEEARFTLSIEGNAQKALTLALENWQVQKEPQDARIVLEAALAANSPAAALAVLSWLRSNHVEDERLQKLAQHLQ